MYHTREAVKANIGGRARGYLKQCVAIGRRLRGNLRSNIAPGTSAVVGNNLLPEYLGKFSGNDTGDDVSTSTGALRHQIADDLYRVILRLTASHKLAQ